MATITPQAASANTTTTFAAASGGGDTIAAGTGGRVLFLVTNGTGSSITATFAGVNTCNFGSTHNVAVTCAANVTTTIELVGNAASPAMAGTLTATNTIGVTYSSVTTITVAAVTA